MLFCLEIKRKTLPIEMVLQFNINEKTITIFLLMMNDICNVNLCFIQSPSSHHLIIILNIYSM